MRCAGYLTHVDIDGDWDSKTNGTSFRHATDYSYDRLVELFGEPLTCDDGKSTMEWLIEVKEEGVDDMSLCFLPAKNIYSAIHLSFGKEDEKHFSRYCTIYNWHTCAEGRWHIGAHDMGDSLLLLDILERGKRHRAATSSLKPPLSPSGNSRPWRTINE
jgi:hypothetical protein|tara:strand:+ start:6695 stop:7171 length:477 start_codon:yes stop_codon:yes gene_type:complete